MNSEPLSHLPPRLIGRIDQHRPGPAFIILCAIHGNEPGGVHAARRVLKTLRAHGTPVYGRVIALVANRAALAQQVRFIKRDLNRAWSPSHVQALLARDPAHDDEEDREQRELFAVLAPFIEHPERPAIFIDLHSTSSQGAPFSVGSDTLRNRRLIRSLGVPVLLGLEEIIEGTLLGFLTDLGHVTVGVEGGQHDDPLTVDHLESVLWNALGATGLIRRAHIPDRQRHRARLARASRGLPQHIEVRHRHPITSRDRFEMKPGFKNFHPIDEGTPLADDHRGEIKARESGRLLMPLYQGSGEDGFFLGRHIGAPWLLTSTMARRARIDRLLHLLPGVHRDPKDPDHLIVEEAALPETLLRIFGYRRHRAGPFGKVMTRRRPDHLPPLDHRHHPGFEDE